jgi:hypothetical protein
MEVNGTILYKETTLYRETDEITKKRSIGDSSIIVKSRQQGEGSDIGNKTRLGSLNSVGSMQNEPSFGNPMTIILVDKEQFLLTHNK